MSRKEEKKLPAYMREQGNRQAKEPRKRKITFSFSQQIDGTGGQSIRAWEEDGLLAILIERLKFLGQYSCQEALQNGYIKRYTKVGYPPHSAFPQPKHITADVWAVTHITNNSKEVVAGYIEDDVFYIIFLDKEHKFWPMADK